MTDKTRLTEENVILIQHELSDLFFEEGEPISPCGVRSHELLSSALNRPYAGFGDHEVYSTVKNKAAALFHALLRNNPFFNGNKRVAFLALFLFCERHDCIIRAAEDELYEFVMKTAEGRLDDIDEHEDGQGFFSAILNWLSAHEVKFSGKSESRFSSEHFSDGSIRQNPTFKNLCPMLKKLAVS